MTEGTTLYYSTDEPAEGAEYPTTGWTTDNPTWTNVTAAQTVYVKAENDNYMKIFAGTGSASVPVPTKKTMLSNADAAVVSGASITFGGISKALANGSDFVKSL